MGYGPRHLVALQSYLKMDSDLDQRAAGSRMACRRWDHWTTVLRMVVASEYPKAFAGSLASRHHRPCPSASNDPCLLDDKSRAASPDHVTPIEVTAPNV